MDKRTIQRCLLIMDKIKKHPISLIFHERVDPLRDNARDYYEKIKKPMFLSEITKKLENKKYKEIKEWKDDLKLVTKNAESYNGKKSAIGIVASELNNIIKKYTDGFSEENCHIWFNELNILRKKMKDVTKEKITQDEIEIFKQRDMKKIKDGDKCPTANKFIIHYLNIDELQNLKEKLQDISHEKIIDILKTYSPDLNIDNQINLNNLSPKALIELKNLCIDKKRNPNGGCYMNNNKDDTYRSLFYSE